MFVGGATLAYFLFGHVRIRFDIWQHPFDVYASRAGKSFQPVEAKFGMGWGGLIGRGFGDGDPYRVPVRRLRLHRVLDRRGARPHRA